MGDNGALSSVYSEDGDTEAMPHLVPDEEAAFPTASTQQRLGSGKKARGPLAPKAPEAMGGEGGSEKKCDDVTTDGKYSSRDVEGHDATWVPWEEEGASRIENPRSLKKLAVGGGTVLVGWVDHWPAAPWFPHVAENRIRYNDRSCCGCWEHEPGPKVPNWWYAAGNGWQTVYFKDRRRFDRVQRQSAIHECVVQTGDEPCGFVVTDSETCNNVCLGQGCGCWGMRGTAPAAMEEHLATAHGIHRPPKRQWASQLFACQGLCDATFCMCCQAGSQLEAAKGHAKMPEFGAYLCIGAPSCGRWNAAGAASCISLPVCCLPWFVAPYLSRRAAAVLGDIDEPEMISCCIALWFPCCSLAQSYRQFRREGVQPNDCLPVCEDCGYTDRWNNHDVVIASYVPQSSHSVYLYRTEYSRGGGGGGGGGYISTDIPPDCCDNCHCDRCCDCCDALLRSLDSFCSRPCATSHSGPQGCCSSASDYCSDNCFDRCPCDSCAAKCDCNESCTKGTGVCCDACGNCGGSCGGCGGGCGSCGGGCGGC